MYLLAMSSASAFISAAIASVLRIEREQVTMNIRYFTCTLKTDSSLRPNSFKILDQTIDWRSHMGDTSISAIRGAEHVSRRQIFACAPAIDGPRRASGGAQPTRNSSHATKENRYAELFSLLSYKLSMRKYAPSIASCLLQEFTVEQCPRVQPRISSTTTF